MVEGLLLARRTRLKLKADASVRVRVRVRVRGRVGVRGRVDLAVAAHGGGEVDDVTLGRAAQQLARVRVRA